MGRFRFWNPFDPHLPLRLRLTFWYLLTLAVILLLFGLFLYWQVERSLLGQVDTALHLAATQALVNVDGENGRLAFQNRENGPDPARRLADSTAFYLLADDGAVWDRLGRQQEAPPRLPVSGWQTHTVGDDSWRVYSEQVEMAAGRGWLQVSQSLEPVSETLELLLLQLWTGLPFALLLAGGGGYWLALCALNPIDEMTRTAQAIKASDFSRRIGYKGPSDEVGRLAETFDSMLDRLQEAFEREQRFTGDAAHELRTPLTALKGRIGVALSRPRPAAEYQATLQEMEQQVDRLIRLSSDLLFMARLDQGERPRRWELIDLQEFVGAVVDQVEPLAAEKSIGLHIMVPPHLRIKGDLDLLIRLLLNLLDNGIKFTPQGGQITLEAAGQGSEVVISIHDTGPGIPLRDLPHLFDRFFRVEADRGKSALNGSEGGAGLGLALSHEITRLHQGSLEIQSVLGQGTTCIVRLPLQGETDVNR